MFSDLIEKCYRRSVELLFKNSTDFGVLASSRSERAEERNYTSIFARDAAICSLGMIASGDERLLKSVKNSLKVLADNQAHNGQIPNNIKPEEGYANFWHTGCIDATLWWLIALKFYNDYSGDKVLLRELQTSVERALFWLLCHEHVDHKLLIQVEASDWADIMPRSGQVLYSNALWCKVKDMYSVGDGDKSKFKFNKHLKIQPKKAAKIAYHNGNTDVYYYLSFANYRFHGEDIDVLGNSLAILFDLPDEDFGGRVIDFLLERDRNKETPMPVLFNPIERDSKFWREHMECFNQNEPYQYHNGGVWPFASCFWASALARSGRKEEALQEFERVAQANHSGNWDFNEWFHGLTGNAGGMSGQSWNAGMFLYTYHNLRDGVEF